MRTWSSCLLLLLLGAACGGSGNSGPIDTGIPLVTTTTKPGSKPPKFTITSSAFKNNGAVPQQYTCSGGGAIPPLAWSGVPAAATILALIVHDPDAPIAGGYTHWVVVGLLPNAGKLPPLPTGAREVLSWRPPCPPPGPAHHYRFKLYALDRAAATADEIIAASIAQTTLVGTYSR